MKQPCSFESKRMVVPSFLKNQIIIMKKLKIFALFLFITGIISAQAHTYHPAFESLEKINPVPEWFKDAKFGIYFHWGYILYRHFTMNGIPMACIFQAQFIINTT